MHSFLKKIDQSFLFKSFTRKSLDTFLPDILIREITGKVLEVGGLHSPYRHLYSYDSYTTLDIVEGSGADIIGDIHNTGLEDDKFDTVIATEVFEHLYNPHKAADEILRLLAPGGTFVGSTRFIYPYHGMPHDYFRFTKSGLEAVFSRFSHVEIVTLGDSFHAVCDTISRGSPLGKLFAPLLSLIGLFYPPRKSSKTRNPLGFIIVAKK